MFFVVEFQTECGYTAVVKIAYLKPATTQHYQTVDQILNYSLFLNQKKIVYHLFIIHSIK